MAVSNPYKTSSPLLTLPAAADGVSVTPSGVTETWSAWVELSASAPVSMRVAAILAYPGVRANGNFYEAELGVGGSGSEVTVAAVRGYSGDPNGGAADANDTIELPVPADVVTAGDRLAVRLRQTSTATTAWKFSIEYWALPMATGTHMPASTIGPVNVPSGSRISVTSGASSSAYGAWAEVTAATDADWALGNLTYFGPDSANWTLEVGVGASGSEVTIATLRGLQLAFFGGFQGGPYNIKLRPLIGSIPSGSRLALRIKSATTVTAFPFGLTVLKQLVNGAYTETPLKVYPDVTIASVAGGPTFFTAWTTVVASTATDVAVTGLFKSSPQGGLMGQNIIQLAVGGAGNEVAFATCFTRTAVWGGGQFTFPLAIARRIEAGERLSIRYSSEAVGSGINITFGVSYQELSGAPDFDNWTDDLIQSVYLTSNNPYSGTSGASAWTSGAWTQIDASTAVARVITAALATTPTAGVEFEVDIGTGAAASEVVATTFRVGYGSTEGTLAHRILPMPQIIPVASRLAFRTRSSTGGLSIGVALHYTAEPVTPSSSRNFLTGYGHTVTGSDNLIAGSANSVTGQYSEAHGQAMDVTGTRTVGFSLDGSPHALDQDGILAIYGDLSVSGDVTLSDIAAPAATTYGVTVDDTGLLASAAIAPAGITQLTGDVTAGPGSGSQVATLANTAVTPGSYTLTSLTVNSKGLITAASSGSAAVDYVVLSNGVQPPTPVDDGAGNFIYVGYTP